MTSKYKPELRSIPLTFMDCSHFLGNVFVEQACGVFFVAGGNDDEMLCKKARDGKYCPRGFP